MSGTQAGQRRSDLEFDHLANKAIEVHTAAYKWKVEYKSTDIAHTAGAASVSDVHVQKALDLFEQEGKPRIISIVAQIIGGAVIGSAVSGFVQEIASQSKGHPMNSGVIVFWAIAGALSLLAVAWGVKT